MKLILRATDDFLQAARIDLERPHAFAHERVGFMTVRATYAEETLILLPQSYHQVADNDYLPDKTVGAMIGQEAIRKALELALLNPVGIFHVHMHQFPGRLWFSHIDLREQARFIPDFFKVRRNMPHGALVLNPHTIAGRAWIAPDKVEPITEFNIIGSRQKIVHADRDGIVDTYA